MKYTKDFDGTFYSVISVEADSPEEAAKKLKEQMNEFSNLSLKDKFKPEEHLNNVIYLPEIWESSLHFLDEKYNEFDSTGKQVPDEEYGENSKFIWGLIADDDLTSDEADIDTMNDIDIVYHDGKYYLSIEEIYVFDNEAHRIEYLKNLADRLREFTISKGYTEEDVDNLKNSSVFSEYYPSSVIGSLSNLSDYTLIDLYKKFRLFVIAYEAICSKMS